MKRVLSALCTLAVAAAFSAGTSWALDDNPVAMNGKVMIIKDGKLAKFVSKPASTFPLPLSNPITDGGSIRFDALNGLFYLRSNLPSSGWKGLGNPAGSKGYKYKGAGTNSDPCKVVLLKTTIVKAVCKGSAVDMKGAIGSGEVAIQVSIGSASKDYCTAFGGSDIKNDPTILKRKDSLSQDSCTCAGTPGKFTFRNGPPGPPNCGTITDNTGASSNLTCNGLYIGSGSGQLTNPNSNPDSNKALVLDVGCCAGDTLFLKPTTSTDTGDIETCTSLGCKFGAPLPLPNLASTATSTCVFNTYSKDVQGEANCATGTARLDAPLKSATFLTGDILPFRCASGGTPERGADWCPAASGSDLTNCGGAACVADPSLQPCPICNTNTGRCAGGFNGMGGVNQKTCTPDGGQNIAGAQFPTSHDCTIATSVKVGDLPVPFLLTTGTSTDTATPNTGNVQQRVFCGYCRDQLAPGATGGFGICTTGANNGMTCSVVGDCAAPLGVQACESKPCESDADCAGDPASRESCIQRNEGAFGPGGGSNMTITEVGTPGGNIGDFAAHAATMVSAFCIPPSFNSIVDGSADIPGPGAVSLPGIIDINSPSGAFVDGSNLF